ncbi:hypothetical protein VP1G_02283 [Cytospora mali]|uniref:Uncharacterized protein n=1 Tax=Cytospora mali TaxID=578113 RepID=A0A194UT42_CYTMA|nr:hypothetical protein VP1G_02283 [Valsa mali var. pyri (nom. inval.)]
MTTFVKNTNEPAPMRHSGHISRSFSVRLNALKFAALAMCVIILLLTLAGPISAATPTAVTTDVSPSPLALENVDSIARPLLINRTVDEMAVGSACAGFEGEWYCMTTSFQRCASGQWSDVIDTADGTICEPSGLTNDFQPAFVCSSSTSSTTSSMISSKTSLTAALTAASATNSDLSSTTSLATAATGPEKISSAVRIRGVSWVKLGTIGVGLGVVAWPWIMT